MKSKIVTHCPICDKEATQEGKNGFILCLVHSWIKGIKSIAISERV